MMEDGRRVWRDMEEFDTLDGVHANWPAEFFATIVRAYLANTGNRGACVGDVMSRILSARGLLEFAEPLMKNKASGVHNTY
jgi:hypothetical protein